jgi:hypothetical protein
MRFSIRGILAFELSLAIPRFWKPKPAVISADYELGRFFIAGFQYHDGLEVIEVLEPGMELAVVREPDNPHDPRAVALHLGVLHLGYAPRRRNRTIATLLDQGAPLRARITLVDVGADPWNAVEVAVSVVAGGTHLPPGKSKEPLLPEL